MAFPNPETTTGGPIDKTAAQSIVDAASSDNESDHDASLGKVDEKEERAFLWRLDLGLLTIGFLGYVFKYLDQINISNAYVSGMKEDLQLYGNELNYFTTYHNIGYMVMLFPSCILISYFGPSIWLPACEVLWGVFTCCLSTVTNPYQVYGLRFLIGFFEGVAWPGYFTIISQWYLPHEIGLRMSLFNIAQPVGAMISGAMQGALATTMNGTLGRAGWRWAFIINGICTIFVALLAFFILPGYPERPNPLTKFYMKPRHIEIALARARRVGRKAQTGITPRSFLETWKIWFVWAIVIAWPVAANTAPGNYFNLWLKSLKNPDGSAKYSVGMLNYLPIIGQAIQLVAEIVFCGLSDRVGRFPLLLVHSAVSITSLSILIVQPANQKAHMAGYYLNYVGAVSTMLLCSWGSTHLQDRPEARTIMFASGTMIAYALNAFLPIAAFPASEAPHWRIGARVYLGFACLALVLFVILWVGFRREDKAKERRDRAEVEEGGEARRNGEREVERR
ncbi:major facilitator superfamily domain-containing protein [Aspergillus pseudoustus]|uniref:Major facilitator superfamily domain-containing protein n=1 Tax=Aspergillus pseudoustus TaxID=1810923 RepID=A0ABR4JXR9_9EURO